MSNHDFIKVGENTDDDVLWCTQCGALDNGDGEIKIASLEASEIFCG